METIEQRRALVRQKAEHIDKIASDASRHLIEQTGMADEISVAVAIVELRKALTDDVMTPVMALMNTDLGFRTDKPSGQLYDVETVKDVVIEAKMRGFRITGNEFNIIAGRFYAAQRGFRRKLTDGKTFLGLSDLRDEYSVPTMAGEKGAIVKAKATWKINGREDSYTQDFAIRVNNGMGADAILGKAERKLLKRVHDIISGMNTPDGDVDDPPMRNVTPAYATPQKPANETPIGPVADHIIALESAARESGVEIKALIAWLRQQEFLGPKQALSELSKESCDKIKASLPAIKQAIEGGAK